MFSFFKKSAPGVAPLSVADAVSKSKSGEVIVVDVREAGEIASSGKAKGAVHVPLSRLHDIFNPHHPDHNPVLKADARIAVYCASGMRSGNARKTLHKMGYADVHNIGGLAHWTRAGGEIERM